MNIREILKKYGWTIAAGVAIVCVVGVWQLWSPPGPADAAVQQFTVQPGQGTIVIARALQSAGLIRNAQVFSTYVHLRGFTRGLEAGTYLLSPAMSVPKIASIIASGQGISDDIEVTIPEGMNAWDINKILLSAKLPAISGREGTFFPETYRFAKDATATDVEQKMADEFQLRAGDATDNQIIIASILEKEAKTPDDMALVAGIIAKRMELGMPLQIDATVGYGWCLRTRGYSKYCDVTQAPIATEIKVDGPYNTYTRTGLPAGPISNPGLAALDAAAHPKDSPYVYYLSTRDGSQLIYAKTLDEHLRNRLKYLGF